MDNKKAKLESITGKVYYMFTVLCSNILLCYLYYIMIKTNSPKHFTWAATKVLQYSIRLSALAFTMPSKTCSKKIQPKNQTVSMDVTIYPLLQCHSSSGSVAKRVIPLYHIIVRMKTVGVYNSLSNLIVASLSKPHTSRTALRMCVCMFSCWLSCLLGYVQPY